MPRLPHVVTPFANRIEPFTLVDALILTITFGAIASILAVPVREVGDILFNATNRALFGFHVALLRRPG